MGNIRNSLKLCGDIGEFNPSYFVDSGFNGLLIYNLFGTGYLRILDFLETFPE
ncbi:MAG: hypothetical protein ACRENT_01985 [Thermodesulfobacteriota bacterium]